MGGLINAVCDGCRTEGYKWMGLGWIRNLRAGHAKSTFGANKKNTFESIDLVLTITRWKTKGF